MRDSFTNSCFKVTLIIWSISPFTSSILVSALLKGQSQCPPFPRMFINFTSVEILVSSHPYSFLLKHSGWVSAIILPMAKSELEDLWMCQSQWQDYQEAWLALCLSFSFVQFLTWVSACPTQANWIVNVVLTPPPVTHQIPSVSIVKPRSHLLSSKSTSLSIISGLRCVRPIPQAPSH